MVIDPVQGIDTERRSCRPEGSAGHRSHQLPVLVRGRTRPGGEPKSVSESRERKDEAQGPARLTADGEPGRTLWESEGSSSAPARAF